MIFTWKSGKGERVSLSASRDVKCVVRVNGGDTELSMRAGDIRRLWQDRDAIVPSRLPIIYIDLDARHTRVYLEAVKAAFPPLKTRVNKRT